MTAVPLPSRAPVLADVVPGARVRDAGLVLGAALLTALLPRWRSRCPGARCPSPARRLAVVLTAAALGPARGVAGQGLYLLLGAVGLPFYADGAAGWEVLTGATGGYLVGFLPAAWLMGVAARHRQDRRLLTALPLFLAGQAVIFAVGVPWLAAVAGLQPEVALEKGLYSFVLGGVVKAVLAGLLLPAVWRVAPERWDS